MNDEPLKMAIAATKVVLPPILPLETFGHSTIKYHIVSKPAYSELIDLAQGEDVVMREGIVYAERPRVVTPYYMKRLDGFSDAAKRYFDEVIKRDGGNAPGIYYAYKNELKKTNIISGSFDAVLHNITEHVKASGEQRSTVIVGIDEYWDASLLKFIYELTMNSLGPNVMQMGQHGLLDVDRRGVPADAKMRIEKLFAGLATDESDLNEIRDELERWGLFSEYQDRFFALVKYGKRALDDNFAR
ncbi:MAG: hypothetical protein FWF37_02015 [Chloroflexi bacterium]|nr:hypothetical protein [Chloroflexota bacterium]